MCVCVCMYVYVCITRDHFPSLALNMDKIHQNYNLNKDTNCYGDIYVNHIR